jgi:hypothetical protein
MKDQQTHELNKAEKFKVASFCVRASLRKASQAVTQLYDESLQLIRL